MQAPEVKAIAAVIGSAWPERHSDCAAIVFDTIPANAKRDSVVWTANRRAVRIVNRIPPARLERVRGRSFADKNGLTCTIGDFSEAATRRDTEDAREAKFGAGRHDASDADVRRKGSANLILIGERRPQSPITGANVAAHDRC